ncbi:MAG: EamA family transporter, partial [Ilumatobacteraceae bacterium]|nr:EamA family transporter [Ilumatobacteraceae bacterium]
LAKGPDNIDAISAGILRLIIGGLALTLISWRHFSTLKDQLRHLLLGAIAVATYQLLFFYSVSLTGVALAALITIGVSPLFSRLLSHLKGQPAPSPMWYVAAAFTLSGLVVLVLGSENAVSYDLGGIMCAAIAGCAYAMYTESASVLIKCKADPTASLGAMFFIAGLATTPFLIFHRLAWVNTSRGILVILYLSLITLTCAYVAFGKALVSLSPMTVVMLTTLEPIVASVLAVLILNEDFPIASWVGAALVLIGLLMVGLSTPRQTTVRP